MTLCEKCPNSEFFWTVFSRIWILFVFSPNAGKNGPEKLRIRTLPTQCDTMERSIQNLRQTFKMDFFAKILNSFPSLTIITKNSILDVAASLGCHLLWTYFTSCSSISIVNFEQVNTGWVQAFWRTSQSFLYSLANLF